MRLSIGSGGSIVVGVVGAVTLAKVAAAIAKCATTGTLIVPCLAAVGLLNALILGACYFDYSSAMEACFNKLTDTFRKQMNAACNGEECPADG